MAHQITTLDPVREEFKPPLHYSPASFYPRSFFGSPLGLGRSHSPSADNDQPTDLRVMRVKRPLSDDPSDDVMTSLGRCLRLQLQNGGKGAGHQSSFMIGDILRAETHLSEPIVTNEEEDDGEDTNSDQPPCKKQRKARTAFSDHQLQTLEKSFERQKYLSVQDRMELAAKLNLTDTQVKTWYQNRRTKWKRQTAVGLELLAETSSMAALHHLCRGTKSSTNPWRAQSSLPSAKDMEIFYKQALLALRQTSVAGSQLSSPIGTFSSRTLTPPISSLAPPTLIPTCHVASLASHLSSLSSWVPRLNLGSGLVISPAESDTSFKVMDSDSNSAVSRTTSPTNSNPSSPAAGSV